MLISVQESSVDRGHDRYVPGRASCSLWHACTTASCCNLGIQTAGHCGWSPYIDRGYNWMHTATDRCTAVAYYTFGLLLGCGSCDVFLDVNSRWMGGLPTRATTCGDNLYYRPTQTSNDSWVLWLWRRHSCLLRCNWFSKREDAADIRTRMHGPTPERLANSAMLSDVFIDA